MEPPPRVISLSYSEYVGPQNYGLFRMIGLDEQGDQFGGAVSYNNIFRLAAGILGDALPKLFIFPVRIDQ